MDFIDKIRQSVGSFFIKRDISKVIRNRCVMNFNDAKTIGIIYNASDENIYRIVCDFVKYFQERHKYVKALGFVNFNRLPHYCFPKLSYDYFTKRDLNWYFKPVNSRVNDFVNEEFDILIDISLSDNCFPLIYVSGLSKAKFKVGRFSEYSKIYDFMLNVDNNISLENYMKECIHYLNIINRN